MSDDELNESILKNNIERNHPELGRAEKREALRVAKAAFQGNVSNGEASEIGVRAVKDKRETG